MSVCVCVQLSTEAFESSAELRKCLARAQMEAELDNALRQLEAETRKCVKRRIARQEGIWCFNVYTALNTKL